MDIEHLVATQPTNFKVFAMMAILGFEGHSELDADERATLAAVERFLALCKDEVWENIEESLAAEGTATTVVQYEYEQGRLALMKVTADGFPVRDTTIEWSEDGCLTGLEHSAGSTSFEADADGRLVLRSMEAGGEVFQTYSTLYEGGPCLPRRLLTAPGGTFIVNPPYGPTVGPICID